MPETTKVYINRQQLLNFYNQEVDNISEECDWKTHFNAKDCVDIVCNMLEKYPGLIMIETWETKILNPDYIAKGIIVD